ncbi:MAG: hypothetical protein EOO86_12715 [Pedobacter sp.]|nr:MAG: hypothetical protein EOO86_12715 [Pedobacter sp.]
MRSTFSRFLMMVCVVGMLTLISATASAQIICDNPSDPFDCYDPDDYPIDDHIYYLIAAIIIFIFYKRYNGRAKKQNSLQTQ